MIGGAIAATASATSGPAGSDRSAEKPPIYVPVEPSDGGHAPPRGTPRAPREWSPDNFIPLVRDRPPLRFDPFPDAAPVSGLDPMSLLAGDTSLLAQPGGRHWGGGWTAAADTVPLTIEHVDRAAALLTAPRPRYPDQLRAAGVTGRVVARFVVDTTGRVEPTSVVIRESSHELFTRAVRAALTSLRFAPAEVGRRKVRMLVDLPFEFRLNE
jgi:protein TonB